MQPTTTETTNESDLVKVEILCADCKDGKHDCAGLWRGIGLEIRCSCRCIDWSDRGSAAENVRNRRKVLTS